MEYVTEGGAPDPISACAASLVTDIGDIGMAIADMPREIFGGRQRSKSHVDSQSQSLEGSEKQTDKTSDAASTVPPHANVESSVSLPLPTRSQETLSSTLPSHQRASSTQLSVPESASITSATWPSGPSAPTSPAPSQNQAKQSVPGRDPSPVSGFGLNAALGTGRGVGRIVSTGVKSPMNMCLGLAKGFRNIPRLYNDDTVRPIEKVTDLSTGIKVAGKELGYGFFDGVAGLVTQPWKGAEKEGAAGLVKGFGKGIGGLIAKPAAGRSSILKVDPILMIYRLLGHSGLYDAGTARRN